MNKGKVSANVISQKIKTRNGQCMKNNSDLNFDAKTRQLMKPKDGLIECILRLNNIVV